jgi:hypothetical protein
MSSAPKRGGFNHPPDQLGGYPSKEESDGDIRMGEPMGFLTPDSPGNNEEDPWVKNIEAAKKIQKVFRAASYKIEAKKQQTWQVDYYIYCLPFLSLCDLMYNIVFILLYIYISDIQRTRYFRRS